MIYRWQKWSLWDRGGGHEQKNLGWLPRRTDIRGVVGRSAGKGTLGRCTSVWIPGLRSNKALYVSVAADAWLKRPLRFLGEGNYLKYYSGSETNSIGKMVNLAGMGPQNPCKKVRPHGSRTD